jgi:hypothetical protein
LHTFLSAVAALALTAQVAPPSPPPAATPAAATAASPAAEGAVPAVPPPEPPKGEPTAPAGPPRVAVLPLDAPADLQLLGRSLAEAVAQEAEKAGGFQVIAPAEVIAKLGADGAAQAAQCGESVGCLVGPGLRLGADRIIGGRLDRAGTSYHFALVNVDVKGNAAAARAKREVPIASRRIRQDVVAAVGPLLRGEAAGVGLLAVLTEVAGADVRIDDEAAGRTPLEAKLPAGKHKVEVSQRGKVKVEPFWVDVPVNGRAEQRVRLYDIPVAEKKPGEIETTVEKVPTSGRKR